MWTQQSAMDQNWADTFPEIDVEAAAARIEGQVERTELVRLPGAHSALEIWGKMENRQVTGSFKSRGALNNLIGLNEEERARGVVASSSGNHGQALAWAAKAAGVGATIVMPKNAYPNKIQACRSHGADVVLPGDRLQADQIAEQFAAGGAVWIHPYDRAGTVEGAGTVGLEIARDMPDVDVVVICVGGGGLSAGSSLALRRELGSRVVIIGAEPVGAHTMGQGLSQGESVHVDEITSEIQGLTTNFAGHLNVAINGQTLDAVMTASDEDIFQAQRVLVNNDEAAGWAGETVEPAGAAAFAVARSDEFEQHVRALMNGRGLERADAPTLRIAVTISGGNPSPSQLAELRP